MHPFKTFAPSRGVSKRTDAELAQAVLHRVQVLLAYERGLQLGLLSDAASAKGTERRRFGQASNRLKRLRVRGYRVFPQFPA